MDTPYIQTVYCEITATRSLGRRLRPEDWPPGTEGRLEVAQPSAMRGPLQGVARRLALVHPNRPDEILSCLFDPVLLDVVPDGLVFRGHEFIPAGSDVQEHVQVWVVRPCRPGRKPPALDVNAWLHRLPRMELKQGMGG